MSYFSVPARPVRWLQMTVGLGFNGTAVFRFDSGTWVMAWRFYERDVVGCNVVSMNGGSARGYEDLVCPPEGSSYPQVVAIYIGSYPQLRDGSGAHGCGR